MPNRCRKFSGMLGKKFWLLIGLLISGWQAGRASCVADFFFYFLDERTVLLYDHSSGHDSTTWDLGPAEVLSRTGGRLIVLLPSDTLSICLTAFGPDDCRDEHCILVFRGSPEEMCHITDCVWPGDANGDRLANNYDLLNLGIGFGRQGPPRPFYPLPDTPLAWLPGYAMNWDQWIGVINYKHLDCDGNGRINTDDLEAIRYNYTPDLTFQANSIPGAPPVRITTPADTYFFQAGADILIEGAIELGSASLPFEDLHGLAFDLKVISPLGPGTTLTLSAEPNSFLFDSLDSLLELSVPVKLANNPAERYDYALSRPAPTGIAGFGPAVRFGLIIESDIIGGLQIGDVDIILEKFKAIDSSGEPLPIELVNDTLSLRLVRDNVSGSREATVQPPLRIFPNPASDRLTMMTVGTTPLGKHHPHSGDPVAQQPRAAPRRSIHRPGKQPGKRALPRSPARRLHRMGPNGQGCQGTLPDAYPIMTGRDQVPFSGPPTTTTISPLIFCWPEK